MKGFVIGLRTATDAEITSLISKHRGKGCKVTHITRFKNNKPLPFNGILKIVK